MQTIRVALVSALALTCALPAVAQVQIQQEVFVGPDAPPMGPMQGRQVRTGTGRLRGRVLAAESGAPLRRAQVRLTGPDIGSKVALTDGQGRYEFTDLPDGRFVVMATKSGYVSVQYGQSRPFESGKPIQLAANQFLDKADIVMPRGSVIAGRVVDEFGEPVADAIVSALRQQWSGGRRRLVNAGRVAQTNDIGQFRIYGLPPGDYYVSAAFRNMEPMMDLMGPSGATASRGSAPASGYAPTYYPGSATPSDAQKIAVTVGQEAQGTDFALVPVRLARVSGIVLNSEGRPVEGAMVTPTPARASDAGAMMLGGGARSARDGSFTLNGISPGDYNLQVRSMTVMTTGSGGDTMMFMTRTAGGPGGGNDAEFASQPLSVAGEDLANVVITTSRGASATGHVVFDGGARPAGAGALRVTAASTDGDGPMGAFSGPGSAVKEDGTFELKGLSGGRVLRVNGLPAGWSLKAVESNGLDVTDSGIEFKGSDTVSGIDIVLSSKTTEINGSVTTGDGSAAKDYTVIVFAEDQQKWAAPSTRWITGMRPDQDGRFHIRSMPAGSYYGIALEYVAQGDWNDPELLDRLKLKAQRFSLGDGENKTLDLKVATGGVD